MKEKTPSEKNAAKRQAELLSDALTGALDNKGIWLNKDGKMAPKLYPKGVSVSPFNALIMGLHSDKTNSRTCLFTPFAEAQRNNMAVREHERGVPFLFYNWNKYVNRNNPADIISREDYQKLGADDQKQYKGVHNREIRTLFTVDQTVLPLNKPNDYEALLKESGTAEDRGIADDHAKGRASTVQRVAFNDFLLKMRENLVSVKNDGSGVAHYDSAKDTVYLPLQKDFDFYRDYMQETLRQVVSATGHQQRLVREGMVMKGGTAPSEDAVKREKLIVELASGVKMQQMGLPARLSPENMKLVDYWSRELRENPAMMDGIEADVNNALKVINKAERGMKSDYTLLRPAQEASASQTNEQPKHFVIADEIKKYPSEENKTMVVVTDKEGKSADVVLPQGASLEVGDDISGMSKSRIERSLKMEGIDKVRFHNPDGALGFRPDDTFFESKDVSVAKLNKWSLERITTLDTSAALKQAKEMSFDQVQMIQDDNHRWALYIKPEGKAGYSVYPDKADLNQFFTTVKQSMDNIGSVRHELALKYNALAETKPDLKVDLFGGNVEGIDMNRIERVSLYKTSPKDETGKDAKIFCSAMIDGQRQTAQISPSQWQRMWIAEDKNSYKKNLAATLFADILKQDVAQEQTAEEKQNVETEVKQEEHISTDKHEEEHRDYHEQEDKSAELEKQKEAEKQKQAEQKKDAALAKQWSELKAKHPDAMLLFRIKDFYHMYSEDAKRAADILKLSVNKHPNPKLAQESEFPFRALDTYLPKLIRSGERVAICDYTANIKEQEKQEQKQDVANEQKEEEHRSGGMRR
jgi:hypothetical protein